MIQYALALFAQQVLVGARVRLKGQAGLGLGACRRGTNQSSARTSKTRPLHATWMPTSCGSAAKPEKSRWSPG